LIPIGYVGVVINYGDAGDDVTGAQFLMVWEVEPGRTRRLARERLRLANTR
jgi:hypothetical protein